MVQWKSGCNRYLLSYEHFGLRSLPSRIGFKNLFIPQYLQCRWGPTATLTLLKVTWNEDPDQEFEEKRPFARNYAAYAT